MRRNQSSGAPGLRAKLARGSAGFGAGPNKRDFSGFGGGRNMENSQVYRHLHRLPFSVSQGNSVCHRDVDKWTTKCYYENGLQDVIKGGLEKK